MNPEPPQNKHVYFADSLFETSHDNETPTTPTVEITPRSRPPGPPNTSTPRSSPTSPNISKEDTSTTDTDTDTEKEKEKEKVSYLYYYCRLFSVVFICSFYFVL